MGTGVGRGGRGGRGEASSSASAGSCRKEQAEKMSHRSWASCMHEVAWLAASDTSCCWSTEAVSPSVVAAAAARAAAAACTAAWAASAATCTSCSMLAVREAARSGWLCHWGRSECSTAVTSFLHGVGLGKERADKMRGQATDGDSYPFLNDFQALSAPPNTNTPGRTMGPLAS